MYHVPASMLVLLFPSLTLKTTLPLPGATNTTTTTTTPGSSDTVTMTPAEAAPATPTNETEGSDDVRVGGNQNGEDAKKQARAQYDKTSVAWVIDHEYAEYAWRG